MASVELRNVSKQYPGGATAVDELSLEVNDREFLVLVGPSGCGKSTTLRMIAGLEEVSRGEIRIGARDVTRTAPKDRNIAMVFQNYALYPHMTVERNMAFGLELRYGGLFRRIWKRLTSPAEATVLAQQRRQIPDRVRQAARMLGIEPLLRRMPRQLSGGERQRVALGRAIVREPAAFLFDEPLSNLDARLRVEMRRELKQLHQRLGATMIYVTHDQVEAMTLGERIVVMEGGRVQQIGTPTEVYERPRNRFVAGFLGSPPMNFIAGRLSSNGHETKFEGVGLVVELPARRLADWCTAAGGQDVVLGIRPEDVRARRIEQPPSMAAATCGRVAIVESLGDQAIAYVELNQLPGGDEESKTNVTCKFPIREAPQAGDWVRLEFVADRLHLFDAQSGANLAREE